MYPLGWSPTAKLVPLGETDISSWDMTPALASARYINQLEYSNRRYPNTIVSFDFTRGDVVGIKVSLMSSDDHLIGESDEVGYSNWILLKLDIKLKFILLMIHSEEPDMSVKTGGDHNVSIRIEMNA